VLTSKWTKSLHLTLILRMFIALLISMLIFLILALFSEAAIDGSLNREKIRQIAAIEAEADRIQQNILANGLTIEEAEEVEWEVQGMNIVIGDAQSERYLKPLFFDGRNNVREFENGLSPMGLNYVSHENVFLFGITDGTEQGNLLIRSVSDAAITYILVIISAIVGIACFFLLSLRLLRPIFDYIQTIEQGVMTIASGDLTYKINLVGNNELTSLAGEINDMGQQIHEKTEKEKQMDLNQRTLITNISHDLRTPLTSIIGYIDLIEKNSEVGSPQESYSATAKKNAVRLEKLINDLFLYTKLTSDDVTFDMVPVNVNLMIDQILELRDGSYDFDRDIHKPKVSLDPDKFHRILGNLLTNAEKYGLEDETIHLATELIEERVQIHVTNLTDSDLTDKTDFLLERMYVAKDERQQGSSGLGLSIVKELTEKMDGEISLNFHDGEFKVILSFPISW